MNACLRGAHSIILDPDTDIKNREKGTPVTLAKFPSSSIKARPSTKQKIDIAIELFICDYFAREKTRTSKRWKQIAVWQRI